MPKAEVDGAATSICTSYSPGLLSCKYEDSTTAAPLPALLNPAGKLAVADSTDVSSTDVAGSSRRGWPQLDWFRAM